MALIIGAVGTIWYKLTDHGAGAVWTVSGSTTLHFASARGGWLTPDAVVRPQEDGLIAYDRGDGHQRWAFQIDGSVENVCAVSHDIASGTGVVVFGVRGRYGENTCDKVVAIAAASGAVTWRATTRNRLAPARLQPE
jgi:hypothetical protein